MRLKSISRAGIRLTHLLLAVLVASMGVMCLAGTNRAFAETATIEHSGEWMDFSQTKLRTGNSFSDEIYTINGEFTFCIDVTTGTVAGSSYWSEEMDPGMALMIGLYDRYLRQEHSSWDYHTRYGYLQYMIWCEYSPDYMEENFRPDPSDFWDVYAGAKAYYAQNKANYTAWSTAWYSDESQSVCFMPRLVELGGVEVRKADAQTGDSAQGDASLTGAAFDIVSLNEGSVTVDGRAYAQGEVCKTIVSAYNEEMGTYIAACHGCLPCGEYEMHESKAPEGYLANEEWSERFSVTHAGEVVDLTADASAAFDDSIRGGVRIVKADAELGKSEAIGGKGHASREGACLAGISFEVVNESSAAIMVDGSLVQPGEVAATLATAWDEAQNAYVAQTSINALPYGTYSVREVASNDSYLLTDGASRRFQIRADGLMVEADSEDAALTFHDQVVRNDIELVKKADDSNEPIQAAFALTNTETGEVHVLVCDRNGNASTASSWNAHACDTNANDALLSAERVSADDFNVGAGVWFGMGEDGSMADPDDSLGALPYGHYVLRELRSDSNAGYDLVERELWVSRDSSVARAVWMSLDDQPAERIRTQAADAEDGDGEVLACEQATIIDTVFYENLRTDGREYTVSGVLMAKSKNEPLLNAQGEPIMASKTFKPMASNGTIELAFMLDASLLEGETIVVFEDLLLDGQLVASHADIDDPDQSVKVVNDKPAPKEPGSPMPKTGDGAMWIPLACIAGAAACILGIAALARRDEFSRKAIRR